MLPLYKCFLFIAELSDDHKIAELHENVLHPRHWGRLPKIREDAASKTLRRDDSFQLTNTQGNGTGKRLLSGT